MLYFKKLGFALIFLSFFASASFLLPSILGSYSAIFSLDLEPLKNLILLTVFLALASLFFVTFAVLANSWSYIVPISFLAALLPIIFLTPRTTLIPPPESLVLAVGFLMSFLLIYSLINLKLKTYITFDPAALFSNYVKNLGKLLILIISLAFFLSTSSQINKTGFEIPDSLLDLVLKFSSSQEGEINVKGVKFLAQNPTIAPDQVQFLKQHPELLKQFGLTPKDLENLSQPSPKSSPQTIIKTPTTPTNLLQPSQDTIKKLLKSEFQNLIKPYQATISPLLALLFFSTLYFFLSLINIFVSPLLWLVFFILEKSSFISFTKEMREVKKLVV